MLRIDNYIEEIKQQISSALNVLECNLSDFADKYHYFLINTSNIHKIIFPIEGKENKIQTIRKEMLREYLKEWKKYNAFEKDKKIRRMRNHLEHIDSRLDEITFRCGPVRIDRNIAEGGDTLPQILGIPKECLLRNHENGKFTCVGDDIDIVKVKEMLFDLKKYIEEK